MSLQRSASTGRFLVQLELPKQPKKEERLSKDVRQIGRSRLEPIVQEYDWMAMTDSCCLFHGGSEMDDPPSLRGALFGELV